MVYAFLLVSSTFRKRSGLGSISKPVQDLFSSKNKEFDCCLPLPAPHSTKNPSVLCCRICKSTMYFLYQVPNQFVLRYIGSDMCIVKLYTVIDPQLLVRYGISMVFFSFTLHFSNYYHCVSKGAKECIG